MIWLNSYDMIVVFYGIYVILKFICYEGDGLVIFYSVFYWYFELGCYDRVINSFSFSFVNSGGRLNNFIYIFCYIKYLLLLGN